MAFGFPDAALVVAVVVFMAPDVVVVNDKVVFRLGSAVVTGVCSMVLVNGGKTVDILSLGEAEMEPKTVEEGVDDSFNDEADDAISELVSEGIDEQGAQAPVVDGL